MRFSGHSHLLITGIFLNSLLYVQWVHYWSHLTQRHYNSLQSCSSSSSIHNIRTYVRMYTHIHTYSKYVCMYSMCLPLCRTTAYHYWKRWNCHKLVACLSFFSLQQDILWFQISVGNAFRVEKLNTCSWEEQEKQYYWMSTCVYQPTTWLAQVKAPVVHTHPVCHVHCHVLSLVNFTAID